VYKENVKVCIRTRPTGRFAENNIRLNADRHRIDVHIPKTQGLHINNQQEDWAFSFDSVIHNASQDSVYDECASDIVSSVVDGYSGTVIAYGQTGAGKTYTMLGNSASYQQRGIIPRALSDVFRLIANRPDTAYQVTVSYLEIYNEMYFDLLDPNCRQLSDLAVRDNEHGAVVVKDLTTVTVAAEEDALQCLFRGESNRAIARHDANAASSRSHCVFTVNIESSSRVESSEKRTLSKLNLVDLAGSERVGKTNSTGATLTEARYINKSLAFLEHVVVALSDRARDHVPFRQNKLTNVLRDSLGGNCKTRLIANIRCEPAHVDETISTLRFAQRMMRVVTFASRIEAADADLLAAKLQKRVRALERELAMHDTLANRGSSVNYDAYSPEEQAEVAASVRAYVSGALPQIEVTTLRHMHEVCAQFKLLVTGLTTQLERANAATAAALSAAAAGSASTAVAAAAAAAYEAGAAAQAPAPAAAPAATAALAAGPRAPAGPAGAAETAATGARASTGTATVGAVGAAGAAATGRGRGTAANSAAAAAQAEAAAAAAAAAEAEAARVALVQKTVNVGQLSGGDHGFHLGIASSGARPTNPSDIRALQQNTPRIGYGYGAPLPSSSSGAGAGSALAAAGAASLTQQHSASSLHTQDSKRALLAATNAGAGAAGTALASQPPSGAGFYTAVAAAGRPGSSLGYTASGSSAGGGTPAVTASAALSEDEAFSQFRQGPGAALNAAFGQHRRDYEGAKAALAGAGQRMNVLKARLDALNDRLLAKRRARGADAFGSTLGGGLGATTGGGGPGLGLGIGGDDALDGAQLTVIDEEEYELMRQAKALRGHHADAAAERQQAHARALTAKNATTAAKVALARTFIAAYTTGGGVLAAGDAIDGLASSFDETHSLSGSFAPGAAAGGTGAAADGLDVGEQFELLERERVMEDDPGSLQFYVAQRAVFGSTGRVGATEAAMRRTRAKQSGHRFK
jgi:kinesin family protein 6/9